VRDWVVIDNHTAELHLVSASKTFVKIGVQKVMELDMRFLHDFVNNGRYRVLGLL